MFKRLFPKILLLATLTFLITATNRCPIQAQINILGSPSSPNAFVLSWSTDSYVPSDYEGKALPTRGSEIRVVAEPTKKLSQDPEKLYYRWFLDDDFAGYASGQGKSVFRFQVTKWAGESYEIKANILDESEDIITSALISIKIVEPQLLLNRQDSGYALTNSTQAGTGQEIKFAATPLFFNIEKLSEIAWQWTFAGQALTSSDAKDLNLLTLKIPAGRLSQLLEKSLSVDATNKGDQYQRASTNLNIEIK